MSRIKYMPFIIVFYLDIISIIRVEINKHGERRVDEYFYPDFYPNRSGLLNTLLIL